MRWACTHASLGTTIISTSVSAKQVQERFVLSIRAASPNAEPAFSEKFLTRVESAVEAFGCVDGCMTEMMPERMMNLA